MIEYKNKQQKTGRIVIYILGVLFRFCPLKKKCSLQT